MFRTLLGYISPLGIFTRKEYRVGEDVWSEWRFVVSVEVCGQCHAQQCLRHYACYWDQNWDYVQSNVTDLVKEVESSVRIISWVTSFQKKFVTLLANIQHYSLLLLIAKGPGMTSQLTQTWYFPLMQVTKPHLQDKSSPLPVPANAVQKCFKASSLVQRDGSCRTSWFFFW